MSWKLSARYWRSRTIWRAATAPSTRTLSGFTRRLAAVGKAKYSFPKIHPPLLGKEETKKQTTMLMILVTTIMAVLYGLAWHNAPAKETRSERNSHDW